MRLPKDPRWLQIAFLCSFLLLGLTARDAPTRHAPLPLAPCLGTQLACERLLNLPHAGLLSPIITSFGLTLLLRAGAWWVPPLAGALAIGSKYALRIRGRHFFNPANFGLCCLMLLTPRAWCSPTQWGESGLFLLWILALGLAVAHRAFRADVSLAFLASWILLRAAIVAAVAFMLSLRSIQNPIVWALFLCAPLTPLLDALTETKQEKPACAPQPALLPSP